METKCCTFGLCSIIRTDSMRVQKYDETLREKGGESNSCYSSNIRLKLQDIQDAHKRINRDVLITPVIPAKYVGKGFANVYFKCENLQHTGSYKARGACNVLKSLPPSSKSSGCTISGGRNFMYAMAHYGLKESVPINVVVPRDCPLADRQRLKEDFAIVKVFGEDATEAHLQSLRYSEEIHSNYIHGYKARGACNVLKSLPPSSKSSGCTISGGRNFMYAMAHYGLKESVPINVVVPRDCPLADRQRLKEDFAIVKVFGEDATEAHLQSLRYSEEIHSNYLYIHGLDRLDLIAGYGTLGLEILSQVNQLDAVICPVGSGGLAASLLVAIKTLKPGCLIYGVESEAAPTVSRALRDRQPALIEPRASLADSLGCNIAGANAFHIIKAYLDKMITVNELAISRAMLHLMERERVMVEGAAACPVAAILAGKVPELRNMNVVCVLSGGNLPCGHVQRVIERGLAAEGRLIQVTTAIPEAPGALNRLLARVTETGADVRSVAPGAAHLGWLTQNVASTSVDMLIETVDSTHAQELEKKLLKEYPHTHFRNL